VSQIREITIAHITTFVFLWRLLSEEVVFLAICALLLSVIGLYTLVSLSILNRTKEVGIRKVMGASVRNITHIISRPFVFMLIISAILGCLGGYYSSNILMDSVWEKHMTANVYSFIIPLIILFATSAVIVPT